MIETINAEQVAEFIATVNTTDAIEINRGAAMLEAAVVNRERPFGQSVNAATMTEIARRLRELAA